MFYNPYCRAGETDNAWFAPDDNFGINQPAGKAGSDFIRDFTLSAACFSAVYDMNGKKAPNKTGDDIGFTGSFFYGPEARSAAVLPVEKGVKYERNYTFAQADGICRNEGKDGEYSLPSFDELSLIYLNDKLAGESVSDSLDFWSNSPIGGGSKDIRLVSFSTSGARHWNNPDLLNAVRCVRADKLM